MNKVFDKIIEKLEAYSDADEAEQYGTIPVIELDRAIKIVKQEAEQCNNGWIKCSERLPKYGEVVMCSCTNGGITISCITHRGEKPSKIVRFGQHSVIAWMELPSAYRPKEK